MVIRRLEALGNIAVMGSAMLGAGRSGHDLTKLILIEREAYAVAGRRKRSRRRVGTRSDGCVRLGCLARATSGVLETSQTGGRGGGSGIDVGLRRVERVIQHESLAAVRCSISSMGEVGAAVAVVGVAALQFEAKVGSVLLLAVFGRRSRRPEARLH